MKRVLQTALAGALLAAVIPACAPTTPFGDGGETGTQTDGSSDSATDSGSDTMRTDAADVVGKDAADVPMTDVPMTDVRPSDVPGTDATDIVTPDVPLPVDAGPVTCPSTTALTLGSTVSGTLSGASVFDATMCQPDATGPEHVYTLHLDAMTDVVFTTSGELDTIISVRTACSDASSEIACDDDGGPGVLSALHANLAAGDYFVIVDEYGGGTGGDYTLSAFAVPPNATCATAVAFSDTMPATGDTRGGASGAADCLTSLDGSLVYYSINVPAHSRAVVTATPGGTPAWTPVLRVEADCSSGRCTGSGTAASPGMAGSANVNNTGDTAATFIVSVGSDAAGTGGPFALTSTTGPIPTAPNATCTNATPLMDGTMLPTEDSELGVDTLQAACVDYADGGVLYYRASVPPASILTVTATPTGPWNPVVRALDACGATTCLSSADIGGDGEPESLRYTNTGTTPISVVIAVGSDNSGVSGVFSLAATVASLPYAETTGATSCDDMTGATSISGVTDDDSASSIAPLPFMFSLMGTTATYFSVTSNGFMQLWTDTSGTPSTEYRNATIPDSNDPNNFIAPLWDDFGPDSTTTVLARDVTTGEHHFTVQWTSLPFLRDSSAIVTMQVKLFATSNRIEFHYCSITPGIDAMNSESATIGVENFAGDNGFQHSFETPDAIDPTHSIILTPVP